MSCLYYYSRYRRENKHFDVYFWASTFSVQRQKRRPMKGEMDEKVFVSHQSWHFAFVNNVIEVFFPIYILTWRVNNYVSRQEKTYTGETKVLFYRFLFCWSNISRLVSGLIVAEAISSLKQESYILSRIYFRNKKINSVFSTVELFSLPRLWQL